MIDLERGEPAVAPGDQEEWSSSNAFLREIVELTNVPEMELDDITVSLFAKAAGNINRKQARRRLDRLVERGVLVSPEGKRRNPVTGRQVRVWRKVQQE